MSIIRTKKDGKYVVMSNALLQDKRMTFETRGLLCYLLSKPNDWQVQMENLIKESPAGLRVVRRMIKEAISFGYMVRKRERKEDGTYQWVTTVYEEPTAIYGGDKASETICTERIDGDTIGTLSTDGSSTDGECTDLISTETQNTDRQTKDSPSAKKPPKAKSQNDIRMETLETHFATIRGCQPIDWKKDSPQRLQKLWRSPLKRILELRCGGDIEKAQIVIERAINKMLKEKLTVATPASIEKVCEDIAANMNREGAERYYIPEGDELERQRLEFENAPPMKVD